VPGTPPSRAPYVVGAVVALVLVAVVVAVVLLVTGVDDDEQSPAREPAGSTSAPASASASPSAAATYTCWDGTAVADLAQCSAPSGEAGLRWVFPGLADARCGKASAGGPGVTTRVLCVYRLADGSRAQVGLFAWASVAEGQAFYDGQGLQRDAADGTASAEVVTWIATEGSRAKLATMYADAPFSATVTYPAAGALSEEDRAALSPRPVGELTGVATQ
jgi:hypothetical protein